MTRWIHGIAKELLRAAFRDYFGISDEHAEVIVVLYGRPGEWTTLKRLQVLLDSHRPPKRQAVYERISVIREAMEAESIISGGQLDEFGQGYALTETGYAECAKALRALAEVLLRCGPEISVAPAEEGSPISELDMDVLKTAVEQLTDARPKPPAVIEPESEAAQAGGHRLISLQEFARRAMFSPGYLRKMSKEGRAPSPVRAGYKMAYLEHEVDAWLASLPRCDETKALPAPEPREDAA